MAKQVQCPNCRSYNTGIHTLLPALIIFSVLTAGLAFPFLLIGYIKERHDNAGKTEYYCSDCSYKWKV